MHLVVEKVVYLVLNVSHRSCHPFSKGSVAIEAESMRIKLEQLNEEEMDYLFKLRKARTLDTLELMTERLEREATTSAQEASICRAFDVREGEIEQGKYV